LEVLARFFLVVAETSASSSSVSENELGDAEPSFLLLRSANSPALEACDDDDDDDDRDGDWSTKADRCIVVVVVVVVVVDVDTKPNPFDHPISCRSTSAAITVHDLIASIF